MEFSQNIECGMCGLVNHEATLIYHDDLIICSLNYEPLKEPHLMVLPKRHVEGINELQSNELRAMFDYIYKLEQMVRKDFKQEAFIGMNTGRLATQSHLHFHILPYSTGLRGLFSKAEGSPFRKRVSDKELKPLRNKIRSIIDDAF